MRFTVKYTAVAGPGFENATRTKPLYSGAKVVSARTRADGATVATSETVAVSLYRLRPGHTYTAELWAASGNATAAATGGDDDGGANATFGLGTLVASTSFVSATTGYDAFDAGAIADVTGEPAYECMMFDLGTEGTFEGDMNFEGIATIDTDGYVIWYHDAEAQVLAFDIFDTHNVALNAVPTDQETYLYVIEPSGDTANSYEAECATADSSDEWVQVTHEARVSSDGTKILTVYQTVEAASSDDDNDYLGESLDYYLNDHVGVWDVGEGTMTLAASVTDTFANPVDNYFEESESMTFSTCQCGTEASLSALDWSHTSAVSESSDGSVYLASLRDINTVVAFSTSTGEVAWSISSSASDGIPSTLSFAAKDQTFYDVHDAQLIGTDKLLLMDDGNNREGCTMDGYDDETGCFTRAIRYDIDWATNTTSLAWEFEFSVEKSATTTYADLKSKDLFVPDGGSATPYGGDYVFVAFTVTCKESSYGNFAWIFQVNKDDATDVSSEIRIARDLWDELQSGLYRAVPYDSIFDESTETPFELDERR